MAAVDTTAILAALRALMLSANVTMPDRSTGTVPLAAYVVQMADAHQSEYVAAWDGRVRFVSGFSGSAGTAVVATQSAALWTDSRYYLQAREQMDANWALMKDGVPETPSQSDFLCSNLTTGSMIGVNPKLIRADQFDKLSKELLACGQTLVAVKEDLVDKVWTQMGTKPAVELKRVFSLPLTYTGKTMWEKIGELREKMREEHCKMLVLSDLFEIAWLFNLRGGDIPYNPVFYSYAIVEENNVSLFMNDVQVSDEVMAHLVDCGRNFTVGDAKSQQCLVFPYDTFHSALEVKAQSDVYEPSARVWLPKESTTYATASLFPKDARNTATSPAAELKAVKNAAELRGMRLSHVKDGVAVTQFMHWLHARMAGRSAVRLTEISVADKLEEFRRQDPTLIGLSFDTISAVGPHASKPHYKTSNESDVPLDRAQCYLVDSGGQYIIGGTTDITRTVYFAADPPPFYREAYTRVLMSHINLARQAFPAGDMTGVRLDTLARMLLWEVGLDFGHGTGHGVGSLLGVHEGPFTIASRGEMATKGKIVPNITVTIEPGYYEDNQFGIRIENAYVVVGNSNTKYQKYKFLKFEPLTLAPIETKHVIKELMTQEQLWWLNSYHANVLQQVGAELEKLGKVEALAWLREQCKSI